MSNATLVHKNWPTFPIIRLDITSPEIGKHLADYIRQMFKVCFKNGIDVDSLCLNGGYLIVGHKPGFGTSKLAPTSESHWQFVIAIDPLLTGSERTRAILGAIADSFFYDRSLRLPRSFVDDNEVSTHPRAIRIRNAFVESIMSYSD